MKPVLFVTGHVPANRAGAFERLHERVGIELALFGGPHQHGAPPEGPPAAVPHRFVAQREIGALVRSGGYRAVIAGTGGRVALPGAWRASQRAGVPFVFWAALWRTPRTVAHLAALPLMRSIYRRAGAVVTYGEHVSAYVRRHGATRVLVAPQAVDNAFWSAAAQPRADERFAALFVGRPAREKGLEVALEAASLRRPASSPRDRSSAASYATSTQPPTFWLYRRSARAGSSSRGGWWSTKP